jgi:hypothetical protein
VLCCGNEAAAAVQQPGAAFAILVDDQLGLAQPDHLVTVIAQTSLSQTKR